MACCCKKRPSVKIKPEDNLAKDWLLDAPVDTYVDVEQGNAVGDVVPGVFGGDDGRYRRGDADLHHRGHEPHVGGFVYSQLRRVRLVSEKLAEFDAAKSPGLEFDNCSSFVTVDVFVQFYSHHDPALLLRGDGLMTGEGQCALVNKYGGSYQRKYGIGTNVWRIKGLRLPAACDAEIGLAEFPRHGFFSGMSSAEPLNVSWTGIRVGTESFQIILADYPPAQTSGVAYWDIKTLKRVWAELCYQMSEDRFIQSNVRAPPTLSCTQLYDALLEVVAEQRSISAIKAFAVLQGADSQHAEAELHTSPLMKLAMMNLCEPAQIRTRSSIFEFVEQRLRSWQGTRNVILGCLLLRVLNSSGAECETLAIENLEGSSMGEVVQEMRGIHNLLCSARLHQSRLTSIHEWLKDMWLVAQSLYGKHALAQALEPFGVDQFVVDFGTCGINDLLRSISASDGGVTLLRSREMRTSLQMFVELPALRATIQQLLAQRLQEIKHWRVRSVEFYAVLVDFLEEFPTCFSRQMITGRNPVLELDTIPSNLLVRLYLAVLQHDGDTSAIDAVSGRLRREKPRKMLESIRHYRERLPASQHPKIERSFHDSCRSYFGELFPSPSSTKEELERQLLTVNSLQNDLSEQRVWFFVNASWYDQWKQHCQSLGGVVPGEMAANEGEELVAIQIGVWRFLQRHHGVVEAGVLLARYREGDVARVSWNSHISLAVDALSQQKLLELASLEQAIPERLRDALLLPAAATLLADVRQLLADIVTGEAGVPVVEVLRLDSAHRNVTLDVAEQLHPGARAKLRSLWLEFEGAESLGRTLQQVAQKAEHLAGSAAIAEGSSPALFALARAEETRFGAKLNDGADSEAMQAWFQLQDVAGPAKRLEELFGKRIFQSYCLNSYELTAELRAGLQWDRCSVILEEWDRAVAEFRDLDRKPHAEEIDHILTTFGIEKSWDERSGGPLIREMTELFGAKVSDAVQFAILLRQTRKHIEAILRFMDELGKNFSKVPIEGTVIDLLRSFLNDDAADMPEEAQAELTRIGRDHLGNWGDRRLRFCTTLTESLPNLKRTEEVLEGQHFDDLRRIINSLPAFVEEQQVFESLFDVRELLQPLFKPEEHFKDSSAVLSWLSTPSEVEMLRFESAVEQLDHYLQVFQRVAREWSTDEYEKCVESIQKALMEVQVELRLEEASHRGASIDVDAVEDRLFFKCPGWHDDWTEFAALKMIEYRMFLYGEPKEEHRAQVETFHALVSAAENIARVELRMMQAGFADVRTVVEIANVNTTEDGSCDDEVHRLTVEFRERQSKLNTEESILERHGGTFLPTVMIAQLLRALTPGTDGETVYAAFDQIFDLDTLKLCEILEAAGSSTGDEAEEGNGPAQASRAEQMVALDSQLRQRVREGATKELSCASSLSPFSKFSAGKVNLFCADASQCSLLQLIVAAYAQARGRAPRWYELLIYGREGEQQVDMDEVRAFMSRMARPCQDDDMYCICGWSYAPREQRALLREWLEFSETAREHSLFISDGPLQSVKTPHSDCVVHNELLDAGAIDTFRRESKQLWSNVQRLLQSVSVVDSQVPGKKKEFYVGKSHRIMRQDPGAHRISLFHFYDSPLLLRELRGAYAAPDTAIWIHISSGCPEAVENELLRLFLTGVVLERHGTPVVLQESRRHIVELPRRHGFAFSRQVLPCQLVGPPADELEVELEEVQFVCKYLRELAKDQGSSLLVCRSEAQSDFKAALAPQMSRSEVVDILQRYGPKFHERPAIECSMATLMQFVRYLYGQFNRLESSQVFFCNMNMANMTRRSRTLKYITIQRLTDLGATMFNADLDTETFELSRGWDESTRNPLVFIDAGEEPTLSVFLGPGQKDTDFNWQEVGFQEIDRSDSTRAREMLDINLQLPAVVLRLESQIEVYVKDGEELQKLRDASTGAGVLKLEVAIGGDLLQPGCTVNDFGALEGLQPPGKVTFTTNQMSDLLQGLDDQLQTTGALKIGSCKIPAQHKLCGVRTTADGSPVVTPLGSKEDIEQLELPVSLVFKEIRAVEAEQGYVLTMDNVLKMILIRQRLAQRCPVVLMGETGCGKTSLVTYLCAVSGINLYALDIHGGITIEDVRGFMQPLIADALRTPDASFWVFLDELNTSPCIDVFTEMLCDGRLEGRALPENVRVLGACNPYRKSVKETGSIVRAISEASAMKRTGGKGEDKSLVYQVLPLPAALADFIWDFGSLKESEREQYVRQMVEEHVPQCGKSLAAEKGGTSLPELVLAAMKMTLRNEDPSCVSLRDVRRTVVLANWFDKCCGKPGHAAILAVAVGFYFRLPTADDRDEFWDSVPADLCAPFDTGRELLRKYQEGFTEVVHVPEGVARNDSLTANIFVMLAAVANRIPLFVVGKPGQSKTLAVSLLASGRASTEVETSIGTIRVPLMSVLSYQCSEHTTASSLDHHFVQGDDLQRRRGGAGGAMRGKGVSGARVQIVIFLDEVGLAEKNEIDKPLKVLHKHLENPSVAFIGLSNTPLDASKMNRAIYLTHLDPVRTDLQSTAQVMLARCGLPEQLTDELASSVSQLFVRVLNLLNTHRNGMYMHLADHRGFYNLLKGLVRFLLKDGMADVLVKGRREICDLVMRNLGGVPHDDIEELLLKPMAATGFGEAVRLWRQLPYPAAAKRMMAQSLGDHASRHLMVIAPSEMRALDFLFSKSILDVEETEVFFGSSFEEDASSKLYIFKLLSKIRLCMEVGRKVVLLNLGRLHESLYEVLNQQYIYFNGRPTCRIALGAESRQVPVHTNFSCIVVLTCDEVHKPVEGIGGSMEMRFLSALLSRFEKVVLSDEAELPPHLLPSLTVSRSWMANLGSADVFPGTGLDAPALLLQKFLQGRRSVASVSPDGAEKSIRTQLLCMMPAYHVLKSLNKLGPDAARKYASQRCHRSLASLLNALDSETAIIRTYDETDVGASFGEKIAASVFDADGLEGEEGEEGEDEVTEKQEPSQVQAEQEVPSNEVVDDIGDEVVGNEQPVPTPALSPSAVSPEVPLHSRSASGEVQRPIKGRGRDPRLRDAPVVVFALRDFSTEYTFTRALARELPQLETGGTLIVDAVESDSTPAMLQHVHRLIFAAFSELPGLDASACPRRVIFLLRQQPGAPAPTTTLDFGSRWQHLWVEAVHPGEYAGLNFSDLLQAPSALGEKLAVVLQHALSAFNVGSFVRYPDNMLADRSPQDALARLLDDAGFLKVASRRVCAELADDPCMKSWISVLKREYPLGVHEPMTEAAAHSLRVRIHEVFADWWAKVDEGANADSFAAGFARELWLSLAQLEEVAPLEISRGRVTRPCDVRWPNNSTTCPFAPHLARWLGRLQPQLRQQMATDGDIGLVRKESATARWRRVAAWLGNQVEQGLQEIWESVPLPGEWQDEQKALLEGFVDVVSPSLKVVVLPAARHLLFRTCFADEEPKHGMDLLKRVVVSGYVAQQALMGDQTLMAAVLGLLSDEELSSGEVGADPSVSVVSIEQTFERLVRLANEKLERRALEGALVTFADLVNAETILRAASPNDPSTTLAELAKSGVGLAKQLLRLEAYADLALRISAVQRRGSDVVLQSFANIILGLDAEGRSLEVELFSHLGSIQDATELSSGILRSEAVGTLMVWVAQLLCSGAPELTAGQVEDVLPEILRLASHAQFPLVAAAKLLGHVQMKQNSVTAIEAQLSLILDGASGLSTNETLNLVSASVLPKALVLRFDQEFFDSDGERLQELDLQEAPVLLTLVAVAKVRTTMRALRTEIKNVLEGQPSENPKASVVAFSESLLQLDDHSLVKTWAINRFDQEFGAETLRSKRMMIAVAESEEGEKSSLHLLVPELLSAVEGGAAEDVLARAPGFAEPYVAALSCFAEDGAPRDCMAALATCDHKGLLSCMAAFTAAKDGQCPSDPDGFAKALQRNQVLDDTEVQLFQHLLEEGPLHECLQTVEADVARLIVSSVAGALAASKGECSALREFLVRPDKFKERYIWGIARVKYFDQLYEINADPEYAKKLSSVQYAPIYECPDGHPYWLGNCSRPWVEYDCATCGKRIGGTSHKLLEGNRNVPRPEWSSPHKGYCYSRFASFSTEGESKQPVLNPRAYLALNFWTHSLLLCSLIVNFHGVSRGAVKALLPPHFPHSKASMQDDVLGVCRHAFNTLMALEFPDRKDAVEFLQLLFLDVGAFSSAFKDIYFHSAEGLRDFERRFDRACQRRREMGELAQPTATARSMTEHVREQPALQLFQLPSVAQVRSLSLIDALPHLELQKDLCPIFRLLQSDWRHLVYCVELPKLLRLPRILFEGFSGRLSKVEALRLSLKQALGDRCRGLWREFADCWNDLRGLLTRVECCEVHLQELDPEAPAETITGLVEFEKDLGLQLWSLVKQIAGYQNTFFTSLGEICAAAPEGEVSALYFERRFALSDRAFAGESTEFGWAHAVVPHALQVSASGRWSFSPELFELQALAYSAPLRPIALQPPPVFEFVALPSDDWQQSLALAVPQQPLAPEVAQSVRNGVRPGGHLPRESAQMLLLLVTKIAHQVLGGVRVDPKQKLSEKLMEIGRSGARRGTAGYGALLRRVPELMDMRLCHLNSLWETVFEHFEPDYDDLVYVLYKDDMGDAEQHDLWIRVTTWSTDDLRALRLWFKHMLEERLIEECFPPSSPLAHVLYAVGEAHANYDESCMAVYRVLDPGPTGFPQLELRHALKAYLLTTYAATGGDEPEGSVRERAKRQREAEEEAERARLKAEREAAEAAALLEAEREYESMKVERASQNANAAGEESGGCCTIL